MTAPSEAVAHPAPQMVRTLRKFADLIDRRPALVLPVWIVAYYAVLWRAAHRPLWFDELFTYYIAMSPTFERFAGSILHIDLNPPLNYLFVRLSIVLFGDSPFVTRLPAMLGFLVAGLIVFRLVTQRWGGGLGLAALGILWSLSLTAYAVEARPYGLLLGFFSIAMLCWLNAVETSRWTKWHAGLAGALAGMLLSHCFSLVFVAAIGFGELVRTVVSRRIDKRVWLATLAPLAILPMYIPLLRTKQKLFFPIAYKATAMAFPNFYIWILLPLLPAIAVLLVLWLARRSQPPFVHWRDLAAPHELAFSIVAFFAPLVTIAYCLWSGIPFWARYGIGASLGACLILTAFVAIATKQNSLITVAAAGLILILFCFTKAGTERLNKDFTNVSTVYRTIRPELPFVAACGQAFLEMDHRESREFGKRLFYLTDEESDLRYVGSNLFELYPTYQRWLPIRAAVSPYHEFVKNNRQFLVLANPDCPVEWLLMKLKDDGAQIRLLQEMKTGYQDHFLYEVTMRS
jgi:hypothetical protein